MQGSWIDWVINADGDNPQLGWQAEMHRAAFGPLESRYPTPGAAPGAAPTAPPTAAGPGVNPYAYRELVPDYQPSTLADFGYQV
jgi:hypothetical protein